MQVSLYQRRRNGGCSWRRIPDRAVRQRITPTNTKPGLLGGPSPEYKYTFGPFCSRGEHDIVGDRHLQRTCVCLCPACLYIATVSACSCMMSSELSLALVVSALSHFNSCGLAEVVRKSGRDKVKNDISHGGGARTLHAACASREVGDAVHRWLQGHHR